MARKHISFENDTIVSCLKFPFDSRGGLRLAVDLNVKDTIKVRKSTSSKTLTLSHEIGSDSISSRLGTSEKPRAVIIEKFHYVLSVVIRMQLAQSV